MSLCHQRVTKKEFIRQDTGFLSMMARYSWRLRKDMRNTLDVADLAQFSGEHLHYEFSMLFVSAYIAGRFDEEVGAAVSQDARWALKNAAIESFAIHLRNC